MKNLFVLIATVSILISCSNVSKEEKIAISYEASAGNAVKFKSFEFFKTFTYDDSIAIWQDSLEVRRKEYLAKMDSAEIHLDKAYKSAVEGKANNTFSALEAEFDKVITDVEQSRLRLEMNRINAKEKGENTPLKKYFTKIEALEAQKKEVIYNIFEGTVANKDVSITKLYYFSPSNDEVITAITK